VWRWGFYEHNISVPTIEAVLGMSLSELLKGDRKDKDEFFRHYCRFFKEMTYDTVSYEICITHIVPDGGALFGGKPGPIQSEEDYNSRPRKFAPEYF
jgi:uroporphyrinogen decarboxylase